MNLIRYGDRVVARSVKGEFNFYTKRTGNLLSNMDLPHSMGFSSYVSNVGEVKNRGWEASATGYLFVIRNERLIG